VVTFIGVLEFTEPKPDEDTHMSESEDFRTGIPNERMLPSIHVLAHRRNHSINNNRVLKRAEANEQIVVKEGSQMAEIREKIVAVIKMIVGGDAMAAEYILLNVISRVHTRKDALILGNLTLNVSNITFLQGRNLAAFIK